MKPVTHEDLFFCKVQYPTFCYFYNLGLTSAGLVVQRTPENDGVHQLALCLSPLEGLREGQVRHLWKIHTHTQVAL